LNLKILLIEIKKMSKKKKLGQFYTTNYEYIFQDLFISEDIKNIIEPFCGEKDLLKFIKNQKKYTIDMFDIDPKFKDIEKRDTINNPPDYNNKFVITNPPYLARNKSKDKILFDKYDVNDLYKCFIKELLTNKALGGMIIIPLNFWSSIRKNDIELRSSFLEIYKINKLNIFEEQVFNDTTYTVCSFQFEIKKNNINEKINITIYPSKTSIEVLLNEDNNYIIGGEIYNLKNDEKYKITRLTKKNKEKQNTNIVAKCIDDNKDSKIGLSFVENKDIYVDETPNQTARTYATLIIEPEISLKEQQQIVKKFNEFLNQKRDEYHSLFLTNYRESKDIARKRISFDLIYDIVKHLLSE
jgi:hypothetical protein